MDLVWPELGRRIHFPADVRRLDVPVFLFAASADRITALEQLRPWYETLQAPSKRLEVVEHAGHLGLFEAAERFTEFLSGVRAEVAGAGP